MNTSGALKSFREHGLLWFRALRMVWDCVPVLTALWIALLVVQGILPGGLVYFSKLTIDSFASGGDIPVNQAMIYLGLAGLCLLLMEMTQHVYELVRTAQAEYFSDHLKGLVHEKSVQVDVEFYETPKYHDLVEQVRTDSNTRPLKLLESLGMAIQGAITLATFIGILWGYGPAIPLILVIGAVPGFLLALNLDRRYHKWWKKNAQRRRWLSYFDAILTHPAAAAEVRLFNLGPRFQARHKALRAELRSQRFRLLRNQSLAKIGSNTFALVVAAAAVLWVAQRVHLGLATVGDLVVFYHVFSRGQGIFRSMVAGFGQSVNSGLYLHSLFEFLDLKPRVRSEAGSMRMPEPIYEGIQFRDVTFRYPGESRAVFRNFNLFIPAGKITAIVGVNGAGKSTLIKLLSRFYDVQAGEVEIDGTDIRKLELDELRRNISVLFQFPMQFHETVADNIALGDTTENVSMALVKEAARAAGADRFVNGLPNKYETLLGKWFVDGCEISGGQWQRIALARAYYRRSQIIVLDEPTSFMDPWSEADWFSRFRSLARGRTGIVITHRFSIAMRADVIHVIDGGRLIESGNHADLVEHGGLYAESWESQRAQSPPVAVAGNGA